MLKRSNGIVHSLTACSKDWPGFCQELKLTSQTHINKQQQSDQVQCIKPTASAGKSVPQVSLWKHQECSAITGSTTEVGQNETPVQMTWTSIAVATLPSMCGGLWASAVSQTAVTSTKGPLNIQLDLFPTVNSQRREADFSHLLPSWKETDTSIPPTPLSTFIQIQTTYDVTLQKLKAQFLLYTFLL